MYWVIQSNIYNEDGFESLIDALDRLGFPYSLHKCVPFVGTLEPEIDPPPGKVIVMGSYTLARIAKQRGWTPGSFISDDLDFRVQVGHWGDLMLNADSWVGRFGDVPPQPKPFFIRPVHDSKDFTGFVTDWGELQEWKSRIMALTPEDGATMNMDAVVQVCSKKEIYREFRTWIVDGKVVTSSQYKIGTRKCYSEVVDEEIERFAYSCANMIPGGWQPAPAYCLDVAETSEGLKIVEVNNLNAAGFYKANMGKLLMALEANFGA